MWHTPCFSRKESRGKIAYIYILDRQFPKTQRMGFEFWPITIDLKKSKNIEGLGISILLLLWLKGQSFRCSLDHSHANKYWIEECIPCIATSHARIIIPINLKTKKPNNQSMCLWQEVSSKQSIEQIVGLLVHTLVGSQNVWNGETSQGEQSPWGHHLQWIIIKPIFPYFRFLITTTQGDLPRGALLALKLLHSLVPRRMWWRGYHDPFVNTTSWPTYSSTISGAWSFYVRMGFCFFWGVCQPINYSML
jgi:hypothetical protein